MGTMAIGTAIAVGKALISHAGFGCEVLIRNRTKHCLLHDEYYTAKGGLNPSGQLPAILAEVKISDPEYPQADGFYFPQVVALYATRAPAVLMQWKFAGMPLSLFVFAYMGGIAQENAGYFRLRKHQIPDLQYWWENKVEKNKTWFYHGDMKNLTKTVEGIIISGNLDNNNTATFNNHLNEVEKSV